MSSLLKTFLHYACSLAMGQSSIEIHPQPLLGSEAVFRGLLWALYALFVFLSVITVHLLINVLWCCDVLMIWVCAGRIIQYCVNVILK